MERERSVAALLIVGGHVGLDLANTVSGRPVPGGADVLTDFDALLAWSARVDLLDHAGVAALRKRAMAEPAGAASCLTQVKDLREAIYRVVSAALATQDARPADLALIGAAASNALDRRRLVADAGGYAWQSPAPDFTTLPENLALAAANLLTGPQLGRVKACCGSNCGWLFLDTTRNGRRRWCSDQGCGSLARVHRHRERKAAAK